MYCKVCGKKLEGTEKFCSDCGSPIDYSDVLATPNDAPEKPSGNGGFSFSKSNFHMNEMDWDLEGYPIDDKKTDKVDFDWASVLEGKEKIAAEERRRAIAMTEEDIYERIQSDRHNDEFDWNLVHTMRIDRSGRSGLSLFYEDDEDLFSADFIPPLNTADSYANMAKGSEPPQSKSTVVIDRIDKSGIEDAANEAAGIQERDYAAMGIDVNAQVSAPTRTEGRKIEKFYTFNRKNEEFQALLSEEYERIRQKVQAQTEQEELKSAVELALQENSEASTGDQTENAETPAPMTRGEVAKASAEAEADEAERLALEAERIAEEAAAKARAAEEAAAKAAAEAQAAEEALKALEEEEARAAEEAARIAAEEEAARKAAEEAARIEAEKEAKAAEEAATAKLKAAEEAAERAKIAEEAAAAAADELAAIETAEELAAIEATPEVTEATEELGYKSALAEEAAQLAIEEAAVDAEIARLNESYRALEEEAAKIEAGIYADDEGVQEEAADRRVRYGDIFDDEDDDDYDEKKGGCRTLILDIIIVILLLIVAISCLLIFLPEHAVSKKIKSYIPFFNQGTVEEVEPQPEAEQDSDEQAAATQPEPEPAPAVSNTASAISKYASEYSNIGSVSEDQSLLFVSGTDYGMEGVESAQPFENGVWLENADGTKVTYVDMVVNSVLAYHSKLMNKMNEDDNAVLELVAEDSPLYGELNAISVNTDVTHEIQDLKIGEIRANGSDYYILAKVTEKRSDQNESEVTTKLIKVESDAVSNVMKIVNIVYL